MRWLSSIMKMGLPIVALIYTFWNQPVYRWYKVNGHNKAKSLRAVLMTDLHNSQYGERQERLIHKIKSAKPDVILLGGDISDEKSMYKSTLILIEALAKDYPCYYVTGNHEQWMFDKTYYLKELQKLGVILMDDRVESIEVNGQVIEVTGLRDPERQYGARNRDILINKLTDLEDYRDRDKYQILLSHRPEHIEMYKSYGYDLILSGHAHGGQVRVPYLINGLYAPNQGFMPKYAGGHYSFEPGLDFIVSRGLSFKATLPRIMNPPEVIVIDIN